MERMAAHFAQLLASIVAAPTTPISSLQLMAPAERDIVLTGFNRTAAPFPTNVCIHQMFETAAAKVRHRILCLQAKSGSKLVARMRQRVKQIRLDSTHGGVTSDGEKPLNCCRCRRRHASCMMGSG